MKAFRALLVIMFVFISVYSSIVTMNHGWNLFPVFFGNMAEMTWSGQFNADFICFLALSALWVAWRSNFSAAGLALSVLAFFGGIMFLSLYLFIESYRSGGDTKVLLLGRVRADN